MHTLLAGRIATTLVINKKKEKMRDKLSLGAAIIYAR
jgi:hypothetical protein